jgi:hypothetical protein
MIRPGWLIGRDWTVYRIVQAEPLLLHFKWKTGREMTQSSST